LTIEGLGEDGITSDVQPQKKEQIKKFCMCQPSTPVRNLRLAATLKQTFTKPRTSC